MESEAILSAWHDFFLLAGTAAATLMGLLFIAVTLNADLILAGDRPHIKRVAEQAFQNYIAALFISVMSMIPGQKMRVLFIQWIVISTLMAIFAIRRVFSAYKVDDPSFNRARTMRRLVPSLVAFAFMVFASFEARKNADNDVLYLFAFGMALLIISATGTSWDLLVRIAEIRHSINASLKP